MRHALIAFALAFGTGCACGGTPTGNGGDGGGHSNGDGGAAAGDGGVACIEGASGLSISPGDRSERVGPLPSALSFAATAQLAGGGTRDVTGEVSWTATRDDDTPAGTFSAPGVYLPVAGTGGNVTLHATDGCLSASAHLSLHLETSFGTATPAERSRFEGAVVTGDAAKAPSMIYPSHRTRFPRNIYKVLFQWAGGGNDLFRLTFDGPFSTIEVYTDGKHPQCAAAASARCFEADLAVWTAIAGSNAGEAITLTVDGVTAADNRVFRAAPIELGFSRRDVKGAIFYWSTTAAGVRRASVSDAEPEAYVVAKPVPTVLPDGNGEVGCVACHTVSRSGKRMYGYTKAAKTGGFVYEVTLDPPPVPLVTTQITTDKGFGTFRPDDQRVVATVGDKLAEFVSDTGAKVADLPVAAGTNPDWSPLGTELAYSNRGGDSPGGASLDVIGYADGVWGPVRTLVPAGGLTNLFPSYSPDGAHVAYVRGKGGHGDRTYQLFVVRADGTGQPIELITANRVVNGQMTTGQFENNMPTWAPPGDYDWIAFNSLRPYGVVYPNGGTQQIWVAAIDRQKLAAGEDPSFPAFRFAFQGLTENNHRAFWTLDVRDPPDGGGQCVQLGGSCASGDPCCLGTECRPSGEIDMTCQVPVADGGACLPDGAACNQTGGQPCCGALVCDVGADGGTQCFDTAIN